MPDPVSGSPPTGENKGVVYVVVENEWQSGDCGGCLLADTGEVLWSHLSSNRWWLVRDLTGGFTDRREALEARYPGGCEIVVVDRPGVIPDDVLDRNRAWGEEPSGVSQ